MVESKQVFSTEWFSIDALDDNMSKDRPYYVLSCNDSVETMAVTDEHKIVLVKQYRPPVGDYSLEFPAGYVDKGETIEEAAARELKEESGYVCDNLLHMGGFNIVPSRINNDLHFFFGKGAVPVDSGKQGDSEVLLVSKDELLSLIKDSHFKEVAAVAMLFLAESYGHL